MLERGHKSIEEVEVEKILDVLRLKPDARVLDLGHGSGAHSRIFSEYGYSVVGIDIDPRTNSDHFLTVKADWEKIPLPENSFDLVILIHSGVAWEKDLPLLHEVSRVLRNGGKFVFTTFDGDKIIQTYRDQGEKISEDVYVLYRDEKIANGSVHHISTLDMKSLKEEILERQTFPPDINVEFVYTRQLHTFEQIQSLLAQFNMKTEKKWHLHQLPETLINPHDSVFIMATSQQG